MSWKSSTAQCTKDLNFLSGHDFLLYTQDNALLFRPNCCPPLSTLPASAFTLEYTVPLVYILLTLKYGVKISTRIKHT